MGKLIGTKLLFNIKTLEDGTLDKFKCRIVAQGCSQINGLNYDTDQLYSPVVSLNTVRLLLTLFAAHPGVHFFHFDVSQAFLWAHLTEDIYFKDYLCLLDHVLSSTRVYMASSKQVMNGISFSLLLSTTLGLCSRNTIIACTPWSVLTVGSSHASLSMT